MPAAPESNQCSRFAAGLQSFERIKPSYIATVAAAVVMAVVQLTGMTDGAEQRLSDAWFAAGRIAPSGRTVLVTFNHRAARYVRINQVPHGDLAELLLKLDASGVSRILIEFGLSDQANEAVEVLELGHRQHSVRRCRQRRSEHPAARGRLRSWSEDQH